MTRLTGLRADIIPHRCFATHQWFYANQLWYYHRPGRPGQFRADGRFFDLVDPDLRDLCRMLHEAGVRTTPSCQGHFYPRERFERIWDELQREAPQISGPGLVVRDSETHRPHRFQDAGYRLPWEDFRAFYHDAAAHQSQGYLGMVVPPESVIQTALAAGPYRSNRARIEPDEALSDLLGQPLFNIYVDPNSPEERSREWMAITRHIQGVLERASQNV